MILNNEKRVFIFLPILVFILSLLINFSMTYNIDFFWEDGLFFGDITHPRQISLSEISEKFSEGLLTTKQFYGVYYSDRPFHNLFTDLLYYFFGANYTLIRFGKSFLFSFIPLLLFLFARNVTKNNLLSLLISVYFIFLPENFFLNFYLIEALPYSTLFLVLSVFIFYFFYYDKQYSYVKTSIIAFLIIFFARISILIKHQARILFLLIGFFLIFFDFKKLFQLKYLLLIISLLAISIPILGFLKHAESSDFSEHQNIKNSSDFFNFTLTFIKTLPITFYPHSLFLLILIILEIFVFIFTKRLSKNDSDISQSLFKLFIFSTTWFILGAATLFVGRTLVFDEGNFMMRYYYSYILFPQTLILFSLILLLFERIPELKLINTEVFSIDIRKLIKYLILVFLLLAVFHNAYRLNSARGGWGDWILGWQTIRDYIDNNMSNSAIAVRGNAPIDYLRINKNNTIFQHHSFDKEGLYNISKNFSNVYVVPDRSSIERPYLKLVENIKVRDNSFYSRIKYLIGRKSQANFYIYQFLDNNSSK